MSEQNNESDSDGVTSILVIDQHTPYENNKNKPTNKHEVQF